MRSNPEALVNTTDLRVRNDYSFHEDDSENETTGNTEDSRVLGFHSSPRRRNPENDVTMSTCGVDRFTGSSSFRAFRFRMVSSYFSFGFKWRGGRVLEYRNSTSTETDKSEHVVFMFQLLIQELGIQGLTPSLSTPSEEPPARLDEIGSMVESEDGEMTV